MGLWIAIHTNMTDASRWNQLKNAVNHTKASAKNWNNSNLLTSNALSSHGLKRSLYLDVLKWEVAHGLIALKNCKLVDKLTELLSGGCLVAKDVKLVLN